MDHLLAEMSLLKKDMADNKIQQDNEKEVRRLKDIAIEQKIEKINKAEKDMMSDGAALVTFGHQSPSIPFNNSESINRHPHHQSYGIDTTRSEANRTTGYDNRSKRNNLPYYGSLSRNYSRHHMTSGSHGSPLKFYSTKHSLHENEHNEHKKDSELDLSKVKRKIDSSNCSNSTTTSKRHCAIDREDRHNTSERHNSPTAREKPSHLVLKSTDTPSTLSTTSKKCKHQSPIHTSKPNNCAVQKEKLLRKKDKQKRRYKQKIGKKKNDERKAKAEEDKKRKAREMLPTEQNNDVNSDVVDCIVEHNPTDSLINDNTAVLASNDPRLSSILSRNPDDEADLVYYDECEDDIDVVDEGNLLVENNTDEVAASSTVSESIETPACIEEELAYIKSSVKDHDYVAIKRAIDNRISKITTHNILLIGIGYNRHLIGQLTEGGTLNAIEQCVDSAGYQISTNVARDTVRSFAIESLFPSTLVHSVTTCTDNVRLNIDPSITEMNTNINNHRLIEDMERNKWSFTHIYVDHFRMPNPYIVEMLDNGFFLNIAQMATSTVLNKNTTDIPTIFLPFTPHTFVSIHHHTAITELYCITYLSTTDMDTSAHILHRATASVGCSAMMALYRLNLNGQERYCSTTKNEILDYKTNMLIQKTHLKTILDNIPYIPDLRFIVLTLKMNEVNTINESYYNYYFSQNTINYTFLYYHVLLDYWTQKYNKILLSPITSTFNKVLELRYLFDNLEHKCKINIMRSQARDKKCKNFKYLWQVHMGRTTQCLGARNFCYPHNFVAGKGVYMHDISSSKRTRWIKDVYRLCRKIIRKIDFEYAGEKDDWVVNISAMNNKSHYIKKHIDKSDIDSQYGFTLGNYKGGTLSSYNELGVKIELKNCRRIVRFDGRLPHEVSPVISGERYSIIFFKLFDRRMSIPAPILGQPKYVNFLYY